MAKVSFIVNGMVRELELDTRTTLLDAVRERLLLSGTKKGCDQGQSYEVPVHADIPHQDVIFLDETDPMSSPMKAKGVAELRICGMAAAIANAIYSATSVRVREYPITLDKLIDRLPEVG